MDLHVFIKGFQWLENPVHSVRQINLPSLVGFSGQGNLVYDIIPLFKKNSENKVSNVLSLSMNIGIKEFLYKYFLTF